MLILGQKSCFLGPTILKIPQLTLMSIIFHTHMEACTEIPLTWFFVSQTYPVNSYSALIETLLMIINKWFLATMRLEHTIPWPIYYFSGAKSVSDVWNLVEKETNYTWEFGSGKPLYKCSLVRIHGGYVVNNIYHHGAADGTSGLLMMGEIMKQYKRLEEGSEVEKKPHTPR